MTPETSYGFDVDEFAYGVLRHPFDPWQRWAAIHAGELLEDGSPRFSVVLILVARQNGKTELLVVLALYWLYVARIALVLGTSTKLDYAKESWLKAVKLARKILELAGEIPKRGGVRKTNGEQEFVVVPPDAENPEDPEDPDACRYKIAAANDEGGRSLSIGRLITDELRQHHSYEAWDAAEPATSAVEGSQIFALSNAGDDRSVVLNDKRADALAFIEDGVGDDDLALFEWSSPEDADPEDLAALRQANPNLGYRKNAKKLLANARRAKARGGAALTGFKTEHMCIRVQIMNPAIDPAAWQACLDPAPVDVEQRQRLAGCVDLSLDGTHATLAVAVVLDDERVRVETVHEWTGPDAATQLERELPAWAEKVRPKVLGWFPSGPAAAVASKMADRRSAGVQGWPPRAVKVAEIRGEVTAVCMGLVKEIKARTVAHSGQAMPNAQVEKVEKLKRGDGWVFTRADGTADAVYAMAGAVHLARTLPKPRKVSRRTRAT